MTLEEYLLPDEKLIYQTSKPIWYAEDVPVVITSSPGISHSKPVAGKLYTAYLTNKRLILYSQRGLLRKKDDILFWKFEEMQGIKYLEKGVFSKKAEINIEVRGQIRLILKNIDKEMAEEIKTLYKLLTELWEKSKKS